jgi:hypothetical protein
MFLVKTEDMKLSGSRAKVLAWVSLQHMLGHQLRRNISEATAYNI